MCNKLFFHRIISNISKVAFNAGELCHSNDSNGGAETSDESSARRFGCEKKIEAQRYVKSKISISIYLYKFCIYFFL